MRTHLETSISNIVTVYSPNPMQQFFQMPFVTYHFKRRRHRCCFCHIYMMEKWRHSICIAAYMSFGSILQYIIKMISILISCPLSILLPSYGGGVDNQNMTDRV